MIRDTSETVAAEQAEMGKEQIAKLVEYLVEYSRLKTPQKFTVSDYEWTLALSALPDHPCIQWHREPPEHAEDRPLLCIRRPELSDCPKPALSLLPHLMDDWDEFEVKKAKLKRKPQDSGEYPREILAEFEQWHLTRDQWRTQEVPARQTFELFDRLFQLKGTLDREGERHALTLGDGILNWHTNEYDSVDHPILLQRCSLDFKPDGPQFVISFSDEPLQFPTGLLRDLEGADQEGLRIALESIRQSPFDLLSEEAVDFMRGLVRRMWSRGEFYAEAPVELSGDCPSLRRDPVLILAPRGRGYAEAAEFLLNALDKFEVPPALLNMVGREAMSNPQARQRAADMLLLFTKASNAEQERVARRLESYGCVLVL
jgi:hypothetical protein